jgi:superfamily II DNA or RNA helicase
MLELRDYQSETVEKVVSLYKQNPHGAAKFVWATGLGKTIGFSAIAHAIRQMSDTNVLIIAHRDELLNQAAEKYHFIDPTAIIGKIGSGCYEWGAPVTVASIQTICRPNHLKQLKLFNYGLVIIDEVHHCHEHNEYGKVLAALPNAFKVGVTATDMRLDKRSNESIFGPALCNYGIRWGIARDHLCNLRAIAIKTETTLNNIKTSRSVESGDIDFNQHELADAVDTDARNLRVVEAWKEHAEGRRTIVFGVTVAHATHIAEAFRSRGIPAAVVSGETPHEERQQLYTALAAGSLKVLCTVQVLTEGFDCLDEETEILTEQGWRGIEQIQKHDLVYSLNRNTGKMELTPVLEYVERRVQPDEKMFTIQSQHVNIRTTEGHEFHIKYRDPGKKGALSRNWLTKTGRQLSERKSSYALPLSAEIDDLPGLPLTDDEIRFIAWFMTDGGFVGTEISISQSKEYHHEIRALLTRLGFDFRERMRTNCGGFSTETALPNYEFRIPKGNGQIKRNGWIKYAPYLDKKVSPLLHCMTKRQFQIFWEELLKGDGAQQENHSGWLWCSNKEKADAYTHMAVIRGYAASCAAEQTQYNTTVWRVSIRDTQWITSDPNDKRAAKIQLEEPRENEKVWCVRNQNSTLVTRRCGKIAIIGNCPRLDCIILARPTQSTGLFLQCIGRGTRKSPGKTDCLILDLTDNVFSHKLEPVSLSRAIGLHVRDNETIAEAEEREERETAEKKAQVRKLNVKREQDLHIDLLEKLLWQERTDGLFVLEVGREKHRIALVPEGDGYSVWARLFPGYEAQRWANAMPLDWAQNLAEKKARMLLADPRAIGLVDRQAAWRRDPASEKMIKFLDWKRIPYNPETITKGEAGDLIDAWKQQDEARKAAREARQKAKMA